METFEVQLEQTVKVGLLLHIQVDNDTLTELSENQLSSVVHRKAMDEAAALSDAAAEGAYAEVNPYGWRIREIVSATGEVLS